MNLGLFICTIKRLFNGKHYERRRFEGEGADRHVVMVCVHCGARRLPRKTQGERVKILNGWIWLGGIVLSWAAVLGVIVLIAALAGCAGSPPTLKVHEGVSYIDAPGLPCPTNARAGGCIQYLPTIYRPVNDAIAEKHELEHLLGMHHTPWQAYGTIYCAVVIVAGRTTWRVGDLMCRTQAGMEKGTS